MLSIEDRRHLEAAQGYVGLAMYEDAAGELREIAPEWQQSPEVLEVWLAIQGGLRDWAAMQSLARRLAKDQPENPQWLISWAYATRRVESIEAAKPILLEALKKHPKEPLIHYNLACYECQLGDMVNARKYLEQTFKLEPKYRALAREDNDLKPLRDWD